MPRRGRKPLGPQLVTHLSGSAQAKQRLQTILETLAEERSIPEACAAVGIGESMFHRLRNEVLQAALGRLEPRPLGRPAATASPEALRIAALEQQIADLELELQAARVREELALAFPYLRDRRTPLKKTTTARKDPPSGAARPMAAPAAVTNELTSDDSNTGIKPETTNA